MATATKPAAPKIEAPAADTTPTPITLPTPEVTGYDTALRFFATRYKQGGRTVYAVDLAPLEITSLIQAPDPTRPTPGNRAIRPLHAAGFGKYIREHEQWISPAMILRAPAMFHFDSLAEISGAEFGTVSFPRLSLMDIHILDGQHRILGMHLAVKGISEDLDKARSALASARRVEPKGKAAQHAQERIDALNRQRKRLAEERVTVQIIVEENAVNYKQMFFDIADNALGITSSVKARFDNRKVVNRALESVMEHPLLTGRVDPEGDRVGRGSPYLMGAKHVAEVVRVIKVGLDGRISRRQESEFDERDMAERTREFLSVVQTSFPQMQAVTLGQLLTDDLRKSSLLGSVLMFRVLAGVYHELIAEHAFDQDMVAEFFAKLAPHMAGPVHADSIWMSKLDGVFTEGGMAPHGRRQDLKYVKDHLVEWAIDKPKWLDEAPKPRLVEPTEEDNPEYGAGYKKFGADVPVVKKTKS